MSIALEQPQVHPGEDSRKQLKRLCDEVGRLAEMDLVPADYYGEFLKRVLIGLSAPSGAIWTAAEEGRCHLQYQINLRPIGLDQNDAARRANEAILRQAVEQLRPLHFLPHSGPEPAEGIGATAANCTDYEVLLAPVVLDKQVVALVEVWQLPGRGDALAGPLQFLQHMANMAALYTRNRNTRQLLGRQQHWTQLEALACQLHGSLNPSEVAYILANEGRRLVDCDRLSIALRLGRRTAMEAISGADVVEQRSSLVQLMQRLCDAVLNWGEKLVCTGVRDDSLPPPVFKALDAYLAESACKLLVVLPLRDDREVRRQRRGRSVLLMECFEPAAEPEQMAARLEVLGRHAASALYNAREHRRIPLRWVWQPLAWIQDGWAGTIFSIATLLTLAVTGLLAALVFVPYPLKTEAKGQLLPQERCSIFSPVEGQVIRFEENLQPGSLVAENQSLVLLYDVQLEIKLVQLANEIAGAQQAIEALERQENTAANEADRLRFGAEKKQKEFLRNRKLLERKALRERTNADEARPGYFWLKSPLQGTLLSWDFRESLTNRDVKPTEPLLRIGNKDRRWEVELKIPQEHIGQIIYAFDPSRPEEELDVDLLLMSEPTRTFKGKLARGKIAGEASPMRDDARGPGAAVLASVRLDGPDIPEAEQMPRELRVPGTEVHAKIHCGDRPMGYSLFYGLWEFVYEKVVFALY